jgi:NADH:ubiquinone oxidoreductase subunit 6 (subunit J)
MLVLNNPIYAIFSFILTVINIVIILILLGVEFLAIIYLIIYIGAIVVLFLFIMMMIDLQEIITYKLTFIEDLINRLIFFKILIIIILSIYYNVFSSILVSNKNLSYFTSHCSSYLNIKFNYFNSDISTFSYFLYHQYPYFFILTSLILLMSMIGSIILANNFYD